MPLRDLVGHQHVTGLIVSAVRRGSLPPSLIFAGPDGVGKHTAALALAQVVNCLTPVDSPLPGDACGVCSACDRIARRAHPDLLAIEPGETGTIKIEVIRDAIEQTAYRPFEGRARVVIIDQADALVSDAQSALLKTLEEPASSSLFVLVTARPAVLLPTVTSRCPRLRFGRLSAAEIADALIRLHGYAESEALAVASTAGGSLGRALAEASDELRDARRAAQRLLGITAGSGSPEQRLAGSVDFAKGGGPKAGAGREVVARRLRALAALVRDLQVCASQANGDLIVNRDLSAELDRLTGVFDQARLTHGFSAIARGLRALEGNASPKVVADWVALQL